MKKHFLWILLAAALAVCLMILPASAASYQSEGASYQLTYYEDNGTICITGFTGTPQGELILPSEIDGKPVTAIGSSAFKECSGFTGSLTIPDSVISIWDGAFLECRGFTGPLTIPDSVKDIKYGAFRECTGFSSLVIGSHVETIDDFAFFGCSGFEGDLIIPNSVTSVGNEAFRLCSGFNGRLTISNQRASIKNSAFLNCSGFTEVEFLSEKQPYIEEIAFVGIGTKDSKVPASHPVSWDKAPDASFCGGQFAWTRYYKPTPDADYWLVCTPQKDGMHITGWGGTASGSLTIPKMVDKQAVVAIDEGAFKNATGFEGALTLTENLKTIGSSAFYGCTGFTGELNIPDSVTTIGSQAFKDCSGFNGTLTLPVGLTVIEKETFSGCSGLQGDLTIPAGVTSIGEQAFLDCSSLNGKLTLPAGIQEIGSRAFSGCSGLSGSAFVVGSPRLDAGALPENYYIVTSTLQPDSSLRLDSWVGKPGGTLEIPEQILEHPVTAIGKQAFSGCHEFTGPLSLPGKVASIGANAFLGCSGFSGMLTIPDSVTDIGNNAFSSCRGFSSLTLGSKVKTIGDFAFAYCPGFTGALTIPDSVTDIKNNAFENCRGFSSLTLGSRLETIGDCAFSGCFRFKGALTIPDSVKEIGNKAFFGCSGFDGALKIGNHAKKIGESAFYNCSGLQGDLTIPASVTSIGEQAFLDCSSLSGKLTLPAGIKEIGSRAFSGCSGLSGSAFVFGSPKLGAGALPENYYIVTSTLQPDSSLRLDSWVGKPGGTLEIPEQILEHPVTAIGKQAFSGCSGFTGVLTIPDSVTDIGNNAFSSCTGFSGLSLGSNVEAIGEFAFAYCPGFTGTLTIPDSVITIGSQAFENCTGFEGSLTIGSNVTSIGNRAFFNCIGFTGSLTIPDSVITIGNQAFDSCSGFDGGLTIGSSVTSIGEAAFYCCTGFTGNLSIGGNVTSIGFGAFSGCSGFDGTLTMEDGINSIGQEAFSGCSGFSGDLTIPDSVKEIGSRAFFHCFGFDGALTIGNGVDSIGNSAFSECIGFTGLSLGNGVKKICNQAFYHCAGFRGDLIIPDSVEEIGQETFWSCNGFDGTLDLGGGVTFIDRSTFSECKGFTGILIIPEQLTAVGEFAFSSCKGFTGLLLSSGMTEIGEAAFSNCIGLQGALILPDSITSIGQAAFAGCFSLTGALKIPDGLGQIPKYAFASCSNIQEFIIGKGVTQIDNAAFEGCTGCRLIRFRSQVPPEISGDAFTGITADAYYPPLSDWSEEARQDYGGDLTWAPCCPDTHALEAVAAVAPTCTECGKKAYWHCPDCGRNFEDKEGKTEISDLETWGIIAPTGHDWAETIYEWAPDGCACTATRICKNDPAHKETSSALILPEITVPSGCETMGKTRYTAVFTVDWAAPQILELEDIDPAGHDWGEPSYEWAPDGSTCTATRICKNDPAHKESADAVISSEISVPAGCETMGKTLYTAVFSVDWAAPQTLELEDIDPAGYDWGEPSYEWAPDGSTCTAARICKNDPAHKESAVAVISSEISVPAGCETMGKTLYTAVFSVDWAAPQTLELENINSTGHDWGEPSYEWAPDGSTCTATRICKNDPAHKETADAVISSEIFVPAGCETGGKTLYTAAFSVDWAAPQTLELENINSTGHDWGEPSYEWAPDGSTCTATRICKNDPAHKETADAVISSEISVPAGCETMGKTLYTAVFSVDWAAPQTLELENINSTGHDWGEPSYEWAPDGSTCTATRICKNDPAHKETADAVISSEISVPAGCETGGKTLYTAAFSVDWAAPQTLELENINSTGHDWGEPSYDWAPDGSTCTATRICKNDPAHKETADAVISSEISVPAGCETMGKTLYTAVFSVDWAAPQTLELEDIAPLGHIWGEPVYEWSDNGRACTASRTCTRDPFHTETVEALITSRQTIAPQVGIPGELTFTATFPVDWAEPQTRTEEIPALEIEAADVFTDIHRDDWYYDAVNFAFRAGLFNGMTATTYDPETPMSRAMLVTVLWRQEGEPEGSASSFKDVPEGQWYTEAVRWATEQKIVLGVAPDLFDPDSEITREQTATILFRYARIKGYPDSARQDLSDFPDQGKISPYAVEPLQWAVAQKFIEGADGMLLPAGHTTRAQMAILLMRFLHTFT